MAPDVKKILTFVGLTYLFCWLLIGVYAISGGEWVSGKTAPVALLFSWIPGLVAIGLQKYLYKDREPVMSRLSIRFRPNRWFFVAAAIPAVAALATNEVGLMLPWHEYSPDMAGFYRMLEKTLSPEKIEQVRMFYDRLPFSVFWFSFVTGIVGGVTISALFTLGEEIGWRGFVQKQFSALGFWKSSLLTGFLWGVWYVPTVLMGQYYDDHRGYGAGMMIVFCLLLAPLLNYIRLKSGSVAAASIFHGTLKSLVAVPMIMVEGGNDLTLGFTGLAGFIVLFVANLLVAGFDRFVSDQPVIFPVAEAADEVANESGEEEEKTS
ncbi:CPBP family intramembrane metalloprotease [bacterium]|nr:CPBP family intramembrane metalloprotease [bacterium]